MQVGDREIVFFSVTDYLYVLHPSIGKISRLTLQNLLRMSLDLKNGYSFSLILPNLKMTRKACLCFQSNKAAGQNLIFRLTDYVCASDPSNGEISRLRHRNSLRICLNLPWAKSDPLVWEIGRVYRSGPRFWRGMVWSMPRKSRKFHEK